MGCDDLAAAIHGRSSIKAVIFGHVHQSHGEQRIGGKLFVNAAQYNGIYEGDGRNKIVELLVDRKGKEIVGLRLH